MAGTKELDLTDLFSESTVRMQSSTIYKALRGDGMRVRPLARTRSGVGVSQTSRAWSASRPGSHNPEKGRVSTIRTMFELKSTSSLANDSGKRASWEGNTSKPQSQSAKSRHGPSQEQNLTAFRRRDLTPVSETSTQRVPFRSTKLERPVTRESLKEDEFDKKPKPLRRATIDTRALQNKSMPLFELLSKEKNTLGVHEDAKAKTSSLVQTRLGNKKRVLKRKRLGVTRRATVVAGRPVITRNDSSTVKTGSKGEIKKTEVRSKYPAIATVNTLAKGVVKTSSSRQIRRVPSGVKTSSSNKNLKTPIVREVVAKARVMTPVPPVRKQLWLPSETQDSYNQFCPDTKAKTNSLRRRRPQFAQRKKPIKDVSESEKKGGTANSMVKSKFENTTDEGSSDSDNEEELMLARLRKRNELLRKSEEFFSQFRYGEKFRKAMPKIIYASELLAKSEAEVSRRMSEIEVRLRLDRLSESASKINQFVPKWTSMLLASKDFGKSEKIEKSLTNAEKIIDGKLNKAREMLEKYLSLVKKDGQSPPTEEMENMRTHSELVQLDMDSLERIFESYERQLRDELEEPTSISV